MGSKSRIVGIMKDFHTHSLHREHLPLAISTDTELYWLVNVKMSPTNTLATTTAIQAVFDELLPEQVFNGN